MEFQAMIDRAMEIRRQYAANEQGRYGRAWTRQQIVQGFVGDIGDLVKLTMAHDGIRHIPNADRKLAHELADYLWSVLVLSQLYDVDLECAFLETMDEIVKSINPHELSPD